MAGVLDFSGHPALLVAVCMALAMLTAAAVLIGLRGFRQHLKTTSGWDTLLQRFPVGPVHRTGGRFGAGGYCTGPGHSKYQGKRKDRPFYIEFAQEGFLVIPNFAADCPILIPWNGVREVSGMGNGVSVSAVCIAVDYERALQFHLPISALPGIRRHVPSDRFQKPPTGSAAAKDRLPGIQR